MTTASRERDLALALCGGLGGAKRVSGLSKVVPPDRHIVVANAGDDFEHRVCTLIVLNRRDRRAD